MGEERLIISQDWITVTFALCLLLLAFAKVFSRVRIPDILSAYISDRFINITRSNSDGFTLLKVANLMIYGLSLALLVYALIVAKEFKPANLNTYLLCLLGVSIFLLLKQYLGKLISTILGFENVMELLDFHRNVYRSMFSYALLLLTIMLFIVFKLNDKAVLYIVIATVLLLLTYNIVLIYTYRQLLIRKLFYFILYLCTLEIAPYLLLYKYFRVLES
ncbi:MAG: DUF4271 domain-containing protein [Nonlabens sp.]|nr:DUF4271 domain-containing protein [Nonlabens sp.]MDP5100843.1 DUF4271 domain-containing protein [Nonlabens sp.]